MFLRVVCVAFAGVTLLVSTFPSGSLSKGASQNGIAEISAKPLMLEQNEGELRTRRTHVDKSATASSQFLLKVSPKNNGSQHLVAGTEVLAPGAILPKHRHLTQDEILLIHTGTAHVWLGDQERELHAGGLVFIPA